MNKGANMNNNGFWQGVLLWVKLFLVLACGFFLILIMPTLGFDTSGNFKHTPGAITIMVVICSMLYLVYMGHCIKPHSDMCSVALQMPFPFDLLRIIGKRLS